MKRQTRSDKFKIYYTGYSSEFDERGLSCVELALTIQLYLSYQARVLSETGTTQFTMAYLERERNGCIDDERPSLIVIRTFE